MTLLAIRNDIITEVGGRTDLNDYIDDRINFALDELTTMYAFQELETTSTMTTSDAQAEYLLPTNCYVLWSVKEETKTNKPLELKDIKLGYDSVDETVTGTPHSYAVFNRTLILFNQVPDDNSGSDYSIRIRYWAKQPRLTDDSDEHVLPNHWERGLRLKAASFVFGGLDMEEKQAQKQAEFDRWLGRQRLPQAEEDKEANFSRMNFGVNTGRWRK